MKWWLVTQNLVLKGLGIVIILWTDWNLLGWTSFFLGDFVVALQQILPRSQGFCDSVTRFEPKGRQVWLTIDDGPHPVDTPQILDLLDEHRAKATFFMIGARVRQHPEFVKEVLSRGHTVGNHTFNHPLKDFWYAGRKRLYQELDLTQEVLKEAGADAFLFRSPVGIKNVFLHRYLKNRGLRFVAWSIRSGDVLEKNSDKIVERVLREVKPGAIILMHEGQSLPQSRRLDALKGVLNGLSERGFTCVIPHDDSMR